MYIYVCIYIYIDIDIDRDIWIYEFNKPTTAVEPIHTTLFRLPWSDADASCFNQDPFLPVHNSPDKPCRPNRPNLRWVKLVPSTYMHPVTQQPTLCDQPRPRACRKPHWTTSSSDEGSPANSSASGSNSGNFQQFLREDGDGIPKKNASCIGKMMENDH